MPNKCKLRMKPNNPDSVQRDIELRGTRVLNSLSHLEIASLSRLKGGLKGSYRVRSMLEKEVKWHSSCRKECRSSPILSPGSPRTSQSAQSI